MDIKKPDKQWGEERKGKKNYNTIWGIKQVLKVWSNLNLEEDI